MRLNKTILIVMVVGLALALAPGAVLAGSGCSKEKGTETAEASDAPKPCCPKMANEAAITALKHAAGEKGCAKTSATVEAAEVAVKKASESSGCTKTDAASLEAAMVALQKAADMAGCPKAKKAVADAAEIARAEIEKPAEAEPIQ